MSQKNLYQTRPLKPGSGQDISQKEQTGIEIATAELQAAPTPNSRIWPGLPSRPGLCGLAKIRAGFQPG